jgi:hypothetical protein
MVGLACGMKCGICDRTIVQPAGSLLISDVSNRSSHCSWMHCCGWCQSMHRPRQETGLSCDV